MTSAQMLQKIADQARRNPTFFHNLMFDPKKAIGGLKFLDAKTKARLLSIDASLLVRNLTKDISAECGDTCGAGSCSLTCGSGSCIGTCGTSCGTTCGSSCNDTSKFDPTVVLDTPDVAKAGRVSKVAGTVAGKTKISTAGRAAVTAKRAASKRRG